MNWSSPFRKPGSQGPLGTWSLPLTPFSCGHSNIWGVMTPFSTGYGGNVQVPSQDRPFFLGSPKNLGSYAPCSRGQEAHGGSHKSHTPRELVAWGGRVSGASSSSDAQRAPEFATCLPHRPTGPRDLRTTLKPWLKPFFVGIYRRINHSRDSERWCRISYLGTSKTLGPKPSKKHPNGGSCLVQSTLKPKGPFQARE